jgi:hypothetical protein
MGGSSGVYNLDIDSSALNDICPCLLHRGVGRSWLVGVLSPSTIHLILFDLINSYMHPTIRLWQNLHLNTKLRNLGIRPGSHWVSPRAVSWVWGCRPPSLVMLSSISRHLFQEPCMLGGYLAGSFPPFLYPSPPIFKPFFHLYFLHEAK